MSGSWLVPGSFVSHSGLTLPFKIECDNLTDEEVAVFADVLARRHAPFKRVLGVPRGGLRLARALKQFEDPTQSSALLIVDDVYTTGTSMREFRDGVAHNDEYSFVGGAVMFAREPIAQTDRWITPVFQLT